MYKTYKFSAFENEFNVEVYTLDYADPIEEMSAVLTKANKEFLWKLPEFIKDSSGAWFDTPEGYKWHVGNFCD